MYLHRVLISLGLMYLIVDDLGELKKLVVFFVGTLLLFTETETTVIIWRQTMSCHGQNIHKIYTDTFK